MDDRSIVPARRGALDERDALRLLDLQTAIMERLATGDAPRAVLAAVVVALEQLMPGSRCSILLLDRASGTLRHGAAPSLPPAFVEAIDGITIGPSGGSCGTAAYFGRPVVASDVRTDPRWIDYRDLATAHRLRSCWSTPIRGRDGVLGTFAAYREEPHVPGGREREVVDRFSHLASIAIEHAALYGALGESEERFRRAFEDNGAGMALTDLDGRVVRVNAAFCRLLGRSDGDLRGASLGTLLTVADDPRAAGAVERATALTRPAAPPSVQFEADAERPDGRRVRLAVTATVIRDVDATPVRLGVTVVDITDRLAAERERRARLEADLARRGAETANRAASSFIAALSQELRTPLQTITGFSEMLGAPDASAEQRRYALDRITLAATHSLALVDDVADIARVEAGALPLDIRAFSVAEVADEVVALLAPLAAGRSVRLRSDADADTWAFADRRRLRQVLLNLVGNAIRYSGSAADVWVTAHTAEPLGRSAAGAAPGREPGAAARGEPGAAPGGEVGAEIVVEIADNGPGIATDLIERLVVPFDRLGTDEGSEVGAGLGLVLARRLVEAMRGRVEVRSTVGKGTVVTVAIPAV